MTRLVVVWLAAEECRSGERGAGRLGTAGAVIATLVVAALMWLVFDQLWG